MGYEKLKNLIAEGYKSPSNQRNKGVCIHHSYIPELPEKDKNYAEIFHKYHYENNSWENGLGYDFVVSWWEENNSIKVKYWTSARWILQLNGAHALNPKAKRWDEGNIIIPNKELVSICVVGNYDKNDVPLEIYSTINQIIDLCGIKKNIFFHSDFDYKTCPGENFDKSMIG